MSHGGDAKYHFVNLAGTRFGAGAFREHLVTLQVKDGGKWSDKVKIPPGERYDYTVKKGVSKIRVKSDVVGWPASEFDMASANPHYHLFVNIKESTNQMKFTYDYT